MEVNTMAFLTELFQHSMKHPANYTEWRQTAIVFVFAEGASKDEIREAHKTARRNADLPSKESELEPALETAEEYAEKLPLPDHRKEQ